MTQLENISPLPACLSLAASHSESQGQSDVNRAGFSRLTVDPRSSLIAYGHPEGRILISDSQGKRAFVWCYPPTKKMLQLKGQSKLNATASVSYESNLQALEWIHTKAPLGNQRAKIRLLSVHERDLLVLWDLNAGAEQLPVEDCDLPFSSRLVESWLDLSISLAPFPAPASRGPCPDERARTESRGSPYRKRRTSQPFLSTLSAPASPSITALHADPHTPDWVYVGLSTGRVHVVHLPIFVNESWKPMALAPYYLDPPKADPSSVISIGTHPYYPGLLLVGYENGTIQLVDLERKEPLIDFLPELEHPIPSTEAAACESEPAGPLETLVSVSWRECPDARYVVAAYSSSRIVIWDLAFLKEALKRQKMPLVLALHALYSTAEQKDPPAKDGAPASASSDSLPVQVTPPVYRCTALWLHTEDRSSDLLTLFRAGGSRADGLSLTLIDLTEVQARADTQKKVLANYYGHLAKERKQHAQSKAALKAKRSKDKQQERARLKKELEQKELQKIKHGKIPRSQLKSKGLPIDSGSDSGQQDSGHGSETSEEANPMDDFESSRAMPELDLYRPAQRMFWLEAGSVLDFSLYSTGARGQPATLNMRACDVGIIGIGPHSTVYFYHPKEMPGLVSSLDLPIFHGLSLAEPGAGELPLRQLFFPIIASSVDPKVLCVEPVAVASEEQSRSFTDDLEACQEPLALSLHFPSLLTLRPSPILCQNKQGKRKQRTASTGCDQGLAPAPALASGRPERLWIFGMDDDSLVFAASDLARSYYRPIYRLALPIVHPKEDSSEKKEQIKRTHFYLGARRLVVETTTGDLYIYAFSWRAKTGHKEVAASSGEGWSDAAPIWLIQRMRFQCEPGMQPLYHLRLKSDYQKDQAEDLKILHHADFNIFVLSLASRASQILSLKDGQLFDAPGWFAKAELRDLMPETEPLSLAYFLPCSLGPDSAPIELVALADGRLLFLAEKAASLKNARNPSAVPALTLVGSLEPRHTRSGKLLGLYLLDGSGHSRYRDCAPWRNDVVTQADDTATTDKINSLDDLLNDYLRLDEETPSEAQSKTLLVIVQEHTLSVFSLDMLAAEPPDAAGQAPAASPKSSEQCEPSSAQTPRLSSLKVSHLTSHSLGSPLTHAMLVDKPSSAPVLLLGRLPKSVLVYSLFNLSLLSELKLKESIANLAEHDALFETSGSMVLESKPHVYAYYELFREPGLNALLHQRVGRYESEAERAANSSRNGTTAVLAATATPLKIRIPRRVRSVKGGSEEWSDLVAPLLPYELEMLFSLGKGTARSSIGLLQSKKMHPTKPPLDLRSSIPSLAERKKSRARQKQADSDSSAHQASQDDGKEGLLPDKAALLATAQKVGERNDELKLLAKSCGQMEDQSKVFYTKVHAMNRHHASKKWYQM